MQTAADWNALRSTIEGTPGQKAAECAACGLWLWHGEQAYRVRVWFCSVACIEAGLFGGEHCRWCGAGMDKDYTAITSRLCSEDCATNYAAYVSGDRSAYLGSGKRLLLWLQHKQPATYRSLTAKAAPRANYCQNTKCARGDDGQPASLDHLRDGSKFCCDDCRKAAHRNGETQEVLTSTLDHARRPVLRGVSRPILQQMA